MDLGNGGYSKNQVQFPHPAGIINPYDIFISCNWTSCILSIQT